MGVEVQLGWIADSVFAPAQITIPAMFGFCSCQQLMLYVIL